MVQCGTSMITLDINLCTAQWAGFNATELALNGQYSNTACQGSVDTSVNPPVVHFQLPVNQSQDNSCRQSLQVIGYWRMERLAKMTHIWKMELPDVSYLAAFWETV